jgi:hypothetical protein
VKIGKIATLITGCFIWAACGQSTLGPEQYLQYVEDTNNGFVVEKELSGLHYVAMFKPAAYAALKDLTRKIPADEVDKAMFDTALVEYQGLQYYTIKMGAKESGKDVLLYSLSSEQEYYQRINYYSALAQQDIYLVQQNDTFPCALYHYERTYGVSPYNNILLGFNTGDSTENKPAKLHFKDEGFKTGLLIFNYEKTNQPTLKL